jgi:hypothetical protein
MTFPGFTAEDALGSAGSRHRAVTRDMLSDVGIRMAEGRNHLLCQQGDAWICETVCDLVGGGMASSRTGWVACYY